MRPGWKKSCSWPGIASSEVRNSSSVVPGVRRTAIRVATMPTGSSRIAEVKKTEAVGSSRSAGPSTTPTRTPSMVGPFGGSLRTVDSSTCCWVHDVNGTRSPTARSWLPDEGSVGDELLGVGELVPVGRRGPALLHQCAERPDVGDAEDVHLRTLDRLGIGGGLREDERHRLGLPYVGQGGDLRGQRPARPAGRRSVSASPPTDRVNRLGEGGGPMRVDGQHQDDRRRRGDDQRRRPRVSHHRAVSVVRTRSAIARTVAFDHGHPQSVDGGSTPARRGAARTHGAVRSVGGGQRRVLLDVRLRSPASMASSRCMEMSATLTWSSSTPAAFTPSSSMM